MIGQDAVIEPLLMSHDSTQGARARAPYLAQPASTGADGMNGIRTQALLPERVPEVGEVVLVRSRRWLVEEVDPGVRGLRRRLACLRRRRCPGSDP